MKLQSVFIPLIILCHPSLLDAQNSLSAQQIMNIAVHKVIEDNKVKADKLTYLKRYTESDVQYQGNKIVVKQKVKTELYRTSAKNGVWYEELIQKNGQLPSSKDNQPRLADVRPVVEDILGKPRYTYILNGIANFDGKDVYSVSFEPRHPSFQPKADNSASIEDKVSNEIINNLSGLVYIDMDDYTIIRVEAHLAKTKSPLRVMGIGIIYIFDVTLEQQKLEIDQDTTIGVNKKVEIIGKGAKFNIKIIELAGQFKKVTIKYSDYQIKQ